MSNPTTLVEQFSGSLGALTGVAPIRYNNGLWLEAAGTNKLANPSFETDASTWALFNGGTGTVISSTDWSKVGTHSLKTVTNGDAFRQGVNNTSSRPSTAGIETWMLTGTVYIPVSTAVLKVFVIAVNGWETLLDLTLNGQGEFDIAQALTTTNATELRIVVRWDGTVAGTFYLDALDLRPGSYADSYVDGSLGSGYGGSAGAWTRAASSASISPSGILSPSSGALAFRLTPTIETGVEELWGECGVKGAGTDHLRWGRDSTKHPFVEWSSNDAAYERLRATETADAGTAYDLYLGYDGTDVSLCVDAGAANTGSRAAVSDSFGAGDLTLEASAGGVIYNQFATFNRTLSASEIRTLDRRISWSRTMFGNPFTYFQLRPY